MATKKKKVNIVDSVAVVLGVLLLLVVVVGLTRSPKEEGKKVFIKVTITENAYDVLAEAKKEVGKTVYFNGIRKKARLESVSETEPVITISAQGELKDPIYIVFGKRIVVGGKAEVHGGFVAKGYIKEISDAN